MAQQVGSNPNLSLRKSCNLIKSKQKNSPTVGLGFLTQLNRSEILVYRALNKITVTLNRPLEHATTAVFPCQYNATMGNSNQRFANCLKTGLILYIALTSV